jgi:hypothetical protein
MRSRNFVQNLATRSCTPENRSFRVRILRLWWKDFRGTGCGSLNGIVLDQQSVLWPNFVKKVGKIRFRYNLEYLIQLIDCIFFKIGKFYEL